MKRTQAEYEAYRAGAMNVITSFLAVCAQAQQHGREKLDVGFMHQLLTLMAEKLNAEVNQAIKEES